MLILSPSSLLPRGSVFRAIRPTINALAGFISFVVAWPDLGPDFGSSKIMEKSWKMIKIMENQNHSMDWFSRENWNRFKPHDLDGKITMVSGFDFPWKKTVRFSVPHFVTHQLLQPGCFPNTFLHRRSALLRGRAFRRCAIHLRTSKVGEDAAWPSIGGQKGGLQRI